MDILIKEKNKRYKVSRLTIAALIFLLSITLWVIPSDVVKLIARQNHVLLYRYSIERFSALLFLTPLLWFVVVLLCSRLKFNRETAFRIITVILSLFITMAAAMILSTIFFSPRYVEDIAKKMTVSGKTVDVISTHRQANTLHIAKFVDQPTTKHSYLDVPSDSQLIEITLKTDEHGFRNQSNLKKYDIVAVGDSFVEGSKVSYDKCWTTIISDRLNQSVYNLGISGASPGVYLNNFLAVGKDFNPEIAIFMIYEGNDFKNRKYASNGVKFGKEKISFFKKYFEHSPIASRTRMVLLKYFATKNVNVAAPAAPDVEPLPWMPIAIKTGDKTNYYSFKPKRLVRLYWTKAAFLKSPEWTVNAEIFMEIKRLTEQEKIRLIFVYVPSKPHVVMPLIEDSVPADQLHRFASFKKKSLPPVSEFKKNLFALLDTQEKVFHEFCKAEGVEFISLTHPLREEMARGEQVYFTYDQHWTKFGHAVVADVITSYLNKGKVSILE